MSVQLPNPETDYYWNLNLKDGRVLPIPPTAISVVQRRMDAHDPIHTSQESIPYSEIAGFEKSSRRFTDTKLLVETAQAFDEPVITDDGAVKARWVKKHVTRKEYDTTYRKSIVYRMLAETEGMVAVAFVLPVHKFNPQIHEYCTKEEEKRLGS